TANVGRAARLHDDLLDYLRRRRAEGHPIGDWVRPLMADLYIELETVRCLSYEAATQAEQGSTPDGVALGGVKIAGAELHQQLGEAALQILGPYGLSDGPAAPHGAPPA